MQDGHTRPEPGNGSAPTGDEPGEARKTTTTSSILPGHPDPQATFYNAEIRFVDGDPFPTAYLLNDVRYILGLTGEGLALAACQGQVSLLRGEPYITRTGLALALTHRTGEVWGHLGFEIPMVCWYGQHPDGDLKLFSPVSAERDLRQIGGGQ